MVGEKEKGRNFKLNSLYCFGRVSDHILTAMPLSRKAVPLCFQISKLLATFRWALFTRQFFFLYSLFLFYPSQIAAALCAVGMRAWCESWRGRKEAAAQPSGPLPALPNSCHQGERIRLSKMISTGQTALLHLYESTASSLLLIRFTPVEIKYSLPCPSSAFCFS